jgi:hypothetical protein
MPKPPRPPQEEGCTCTWAWVPRAQRWVRFQQRGQKCPVHSQWEDKEKK